MRPFGKCVSVILLCRRRKSLKRRRTVACGDLKVGMVVLVVMEYTMYAPIPSPTFSGWETVTSSSCCSVPSSCAEQREEMRD